MKVEFHSTNNIAKCIEATVCASVPCIAKGIMRGATPLLFNAAAGGRAWPRVMTVSAVFANSQFYGGYVLEQSCSKRVISAKNTPTTIGVYATRGDFSEEAHPYLVDIREALRAGGCIPEGEMKRGCILGVCTADNIDRDTAMRLMPQAGVVHTLCKYFLHLTNFKCLTVPLPVTAKPLACTRTKWFPCKTSDWEEVERRLAGQHA
jgi:hypothetical protein